MTTNQLIDDAMKLLKILRFDTERSNKRSAMTLLALAQLDSNKQWNDATDGRYTTREIMDWIQDHFGVIYKPNTRETIRRFTLHQFYEAGVVLHNDDDPDRAINSPKNCYRLTPNVLRVIQSWGTSIFDTEVSNFFSNVKTWKELQMQSRNIHRIPITLLDGKRITLSAGGQNILIKHIIDSFCSRFILNGVLLYLDDTDKATGEVLSASMRQLGLEIPKHGKAPDLIVWDRNNDWLFLIEACSTHGPIDVTRKNELERMFFSHKDKIVFVSCFPDIKTMRKYLLTLAWETEAWCADFPDHMIHFNGSRFLGPYHTNQ